MKPIEFFMITLATASLVAACQAPPQAPMTPVPQNNGNAPAANHQPGAQAPGATSPNAPGNAPNTPGAPANPANPAQPANPAVPGGTSGGTSDGDSDFDLVSHPCAPGEYTQVERLARPAVNEGLLLSNTLLNAWNTVTPAADLSDAAASIAAEASTVLSAIGNQPNDINAIFGAFLPDVMRIDTTVASGYADRSGMPAGNLANVVFVDSDAGTLDARPIGGRMIKDDVIDTTLFVLINDDIPNPTRAALETDHVAYSDEHREPKAVFPYLVPPH